MVYFIIGYTIAYYILSAIVISNEPLPEPGMIGFTSRSVIVTKHTTLLIMFFYNNLQIMILDWTKYAIIHIVRCSLAIVVSLVSVLYIGYIGTCYVRIIDAWRIFIQLLVAWVSVIALIQAISSDTNYLNETFLEMRSMKEVATFFFIGAAVIAVIVLVFTIIYIKKYPGGVGEDGVYGHGTKSYTEAFLPRSNNVAISSIKNLVLNNIRYHKKRDSSNENANGNENNETAQEGTSQPSTAHHHHRNNNKINNETLSPTPRLLYLQDELKNIEDD